MKKENISKMTIENFEILVLKLGKETILDLNEMSQVRGGDGTDPIILPPPPSGGN